MITAEKLRELQKLLDEFNCDYREPDLIIAISDLIEYDAVEYSDTKWVEYDIEDYSEDEIRKAADYFQDLGYDVDICKDINLITISW